jgi:hypothetical protein
MWGEPVERFTNIWRRYPEEFAAKFSGVWAVSSSIAVR